MRRDYMIVSRSVAQELCANKAWPGQFKKLLSSKAVEEEQNDHHACSYHAKANWRWLSWHHTRDTHVYVSEKLWDHQIVVPEVEVCEIRPEIDVFTKMGTKTSGI